MKNTEEKKKFIDDEWLGKDGQGNPNSMFNHNAMLARAAKKRAKEELLKIEQDSNETHPIDVILKC